MAPEAVGGKTPAFSERKKTTISSLVALKSITPLMSSKAPPALDAKIHGAAEEPRPLPRVLGTRFGDQRVQGGGLYREG